MSEITVELYKPSPKQLLAHSCTKKDLLYGGAKGGGKSYWLCNEMYRFGMIKGNRLFFGRKRAVDFNKTTLRTWIKTIPAQLYKINEQKKTITLTGFNSVIDYGGMDNRESIEKFNSAEYSVIGLDQLEEFERDDYAMARGSLRHKLPDGRFPPYRMRSSANPKKGWLKDYFISNPSEEAAFIQALPTDNPFLPPDYIKNLEETYRYRPELLRAYKDGSWEELEGANIIIKDAWIRQAVNLIRRDVVLGENYKVISCDVARYGDDETVIYVLHNRRVIDQLIYGKKDTEVTALNLLEMFKKHNANLIVVDGDGVGGGVCDKLKKTQTPFCEIHSNGKPQSQHLNFDNLKVEMWWNAGEMFANESVSIPNDYMLAQELGIVTYTEIGNIYISDKDDIKKEIKRSPDRADALVYGLWGCKILESRPKPPPRQNPLDQMFRKDETPHEYKPRNKYTGY